MFKAGFARADITPPLGTYMTGYFEDRHSKGVLDPIYLNAVAYTDGKKTNLIITCDATNINACYAEEIRKLIAKETGVSSDAVFINVLHQHTAFSLLKAHPEKTPGEIYRGMLYRKFCDVSLMAIDDMRDAEIYTGTLETSEPVSFVRRYVMRDGSIRTNPGYRNKDVDHPIGDADNTVRLIRFKTKYGKDIALINFSTHPDVIGGEKYSADWPGFVRTFFEKDIGDVSCIVVNGCQGDVNHIDISKPGIWPGPAKDRNGYCYDYRYSRKMGRMIADTAEELWETKLKKHKEGAAFAGVRYAKIKTSRAGEEKTREAEALMRDHLKNGTYYTMEQLAEARRILGLKFVPDYIEIPVSVQGVSDIVFVGFGGEPFTEYATEMRASLPGSFVISACLTNGGEGYLPSKQAFAEGGYEATTSVFSDVLPGKLWACARDMFKKFGVK